MFDISWTEAIVAVVAIGASCITYCTRMSYKHEIDKIVATQAVEKKG